MRHDPAIIRQRIFDIISGRDRNNPIFSREIELALGISSSRVRDAIRELRRYGEPIVAGENGYYMATCTEEVDLIVKDLRCRIESMGKTISALKRNAYEKFGNQGHLFSNGIQKDGPGTTDGAHKYCEEESTERRLFHVPDDYKQGASEGSGQRGTMSGARKDFSLDTLL